MDKRRILPALAAAIGALSIAAPASAQQWKIDQGEAVSLEYRNAADTESMLSVSCGAGYSDIAIGLPPGIKPPASAPELRVREQSGVQTIKLQWDVCGGELTFTDRPAGDASSYFVKAKDKQLALRFAERALSLDIDAPGIKLAAPADKTIFARFAAMCRKQK